MRKEPTEVIVALDVDTLSEAERLLDCLEGTIRHYKVGLRLFTAHGRRAVDLVHKHGGSVFLDLKLHDIPQTVADAVREAQRMDVRSLSVHLSGGAAMLEAAAAVSPRPKLWGVTVLTSMSPSDLRALHPRASLPAAVKRLAGLGQAHHADGVICSGQEVAMLKRTVSLPFICPGIRPAGGDLQDQKRVVTPADAVRLGIRYAVVGRPIIKAADPQKAAQDILREMA